MNTPRSIIAVYRVPANSVSGLKRVDANSVQVPVSIPFQRIAIRIPARLTISDKVEDGVRLYTAQLVFRTCEDIDDRERMVYSCKAADGKFFLIGTGERPFPVTTVNEPHPDNMTDSQMNEVTVSYTSAAKIPYIL